MDKQRLQRENLDFAGTCGVSDNNRCAGYLPAFREEGTGRIEVARRQDGTPAPLHLISYLPREWAATVDASGAILALRENIVSGFVKGSKFYTREEVVIAMGAERDAS